jgi:hypothetical protein
MNPLTLEEVWTSVIPLMMEAVWNSETLANFYQSTRLYNAEESHLRNFNNFLPSDGIVNVSKSKL